MDNELKNALYHRKNWKKNKQSKKHHSNSS